MDNIHNELFKFMIGCLIKKYGLLLTTRECAETIGISSRTLDERRKALKDCPRFIDAKKGIMYPVQEVVHYQLRKSKECLEVIE